MVVEEEPEAAVAKGAEVPGAAGVTVWITRQAEARERERAVRTRLGLRIFTQTASFE